MLQVAEILDVADHPAFATDGRDMTVACNRAAEEFLGCGREAILGKAFQELIEAREPIGGLLDGSLPKMVWRGEPVSALEIDALDASGESVRIAVSAVVVRGLDRRRDRVVYHLIPRPRRRSTDRAIDRLLGHDRYRGQRTLADAEANPKSLSHREREVLALLAVGAGTADIASTLGVSANTVRSHLKKAFRKLGVHSRAEAVSLALQQHLI